MIKMIFSDMDGTLLTDENKLPDDFDEVLAQLKKRGVIFAPASGRQYFSLLLSFEKYKDELLFVAENGTLVMQGGKEIFSKPMGEENAKKVLAASESFKDILRVYCGKKDAYLRTEQNIPEYHAELMKYYTHNGVVDNWEDVDDTAIKVAFYDKTGHALENIYKPLEHFNETLQVIQSSDYWVDVMSQGIGKGVAIKNVQKIFGIKPEECAAFGDYLNDYDMMQAVEYSFAVANAHPEIKKIAKYETLSNQQFGVTAGIKKLMAEGLI